MSKRYRPKRNHIWHRNLKHQKFTDSSLKHWLRIDSGEGIQDCLLKSGLKDEILRTLVKYVFFP